MYRLIKTGWWVPSLVLLLLVGLVLANLETAGLGLTITGLSERSDSGAGDPQQLPSKQLVVPFEDQGQTRWCFEASLSMVLQYFGKQVSPGDVAEGLGVGPDGSTSFLQIFGSSVRSYISRWPDLSTYRHLGNWDFARYVDLIDAGSPVVVSTFGMPGHTVVVTGYSEANDEKYLYINDPSGFYTKMAWGTGMTSQARVNWSQFSRNLWFELVVAKNQ
jgi:hypothetical protein